LDDAAAHARMRELVLALRAELLTVVRAGDGDAALAELVRTHRQAASVDGFDRDAVDALTATLKARLRELNGASR
jgi:cell division FtsZ-interacting protein ZapD